MSKRQLLMILGVWVMLILYLGFPAHWDKFLLLVTGLVIIFIAYRMKDDRPGKGDGYEKPYVDYQSPKNDGPINS